MTDISLTNEAMKCIRMATQTAHVDIIDCMIDEDKIIFVVRRGQLGAAIGKKAKNLERLRNMFKKNIKFVEETPDKAQFIKNLCKPYTTQNIELSGSEDEPVAKIQVSAADKSKIIGRKGKNIELIRKLAQRHHNFKDVQIK